VVYVPKLDEVQALFKTPKLVWFEDIEHVPSQFKRCLLGELRGLVEAPIEVDDVGQSQRIPRAGAEVAQQWLSEGFVRFNQAAAGLPEGAGCNKVGSPLMRSVLLPPGG